MPYPVPTTRAATQVGRGNRRRDTAPEVRIRSALHRAGLRFRKDRVIDLSDRRVRADIVFTRRRVAVFIDGCFWHRCPYHGRTPASNTAYWVPKLQRNVERDREVTAALSEAGWHVIRIWEHEPVPQAVERIIEALRSQPGQGHS